LLQDIIVDGILSRDEMLKLSKMTHGYSAADFEKLYALATLTAIRRQESSTSINVALADFESALLQMRPSIIADLPAIPLSHPMPRLIGVDAIKSKILVSGPG
jgi:SpoVK/Ycf46/Vps4 family AAA+-type ATPase